MESRPPISNGVNTFLAGSFVKRDGAGLLAACITADVVCIGWSPGMSVPVGAKRPQTYWQADYPWSPEGTEYLMNITNAAGVVGAGAPALDSVVVGNSYGLYRWTTGPYTGMQALNVADTTTTLFTVTALGDNTFNEAPSTFVNGLVRVRVIPSKIQL